MKTFAALVLLYTLPALATVYGYEDRVDVTAANPTLLQWAAPVAAVVRSNAVQINGSVATVRSRGTLEDVLNLSPFQAFSSQPVATGLICTAVLIRPSILLTAHYCVVGSDGRDLTPQLSFVFGYTSEASNSANALTTAASEVYRARRILYTTDADAQGDFALVELDRAVAGRTPATLDSHAAALLSDGAPWLGMGYTCGTPLKAAGNAHARQVYETEGYAVTDIDASRGWGGGPVFDATTGHLLGIITRGDTDLVSVPGMSGLVWNALAQSDGRGGDITLAPAILRHLPR